MATGIITLPSPYSVLETLDRLESILRAKNIKVFTRIDHSGEAEKVGLNMPPTQLLIFGGPKGGTPLMLASPLSAIDLPHKALSWQDVEGKVWLSYNDPQYIKDRHSIPEDLLLPISNLNSLIEQAVI
jgi:uncharacterized protein (DUF302 family)